MIEPYVENWRFGLLMLAPTVGAAIIGYLNRLALPPVEEKTMRISEALKKLDEAVGEGHLYGQTSVVYPGLTAIQALRWLTEGFLQSFPKEEQDREVMQVHPKVAVRIDQICRNKIAHGEPGADPTIAALFFLAHPEERADAPFKIPASAVDWALEIEERRNPKPEKPEQPGKRKFL